MQHSNSVYANLCMHVRIGRSFGICLAPGFYVRAMAIFEVMLALTLPSLRSGARCAPIAARIAFLLAI